MFCIRDSAGKKIYFIYKSQLPYMSDRRKPIIALTGATGFFGQPPDGLNAYKRTQHNSFWTFGKKRISAGTNLQTFTLVRN
jgi:hypothetical protein